MESICKDWERNLFFQMTSFQQVITRHTKQQRNMTHAKELSKSPETQPKEIQASNLLEKDFKTTVLNMLGELN